MMKATILSIGDELLIGDTVNTNASWMAQRLREWGIPLESILTISDNANQMREVLSDSLATYDYIFTTGGLGPTHDDVTKKVICELLDKELIEHTPTLTHIQSYFKKRGIPFTKSNYAQALIPEGAEVLQNNMGTAPGLWIPVEKATLIVLPGVPREMKFLMEHRVAQKVQQDRSDNTVIRKVVYRKTAGIGESELSDTYLPDLPEIAEPHGSVAFLPGVEGVTLRITAEASDEQEADERLAPMLNYIQKQAGPFIYAEQQNESLSAALGKRLLDKKMKIATAESCTGGLLGSTLTDISGSSGYYVGGEITYSDQAKIRELDVSRADLDEFGAVSAPVAAQMAKAVAKKNHAHIGISTTGIAGPTGGTDSKPVGTVWFGFFAEDKKTGEEQHYTCKAVLTKDRTINKERSVAIAMELVRRYLDGIDALPYGMRKREVA